MGCMQQSQRFRIPSLGFRWERKYHVVFVPKCRRKTLYGQIRREWGGIFRELARQRESEIIEGHSVLEHVHMLISVPPKYAVAQVMGYIKGKKNSLESGIFASLPFGAFTAVLAGKNGGTGIAHGIEAIS